MYIAGPGRRSAGAEALEAACGCPGPVLHTARPPGRAGRAGTAGGQPGPGPGMQGREYDGSTYEGPGSAWPRGRGVRAAVYMVRVGMRSGHERPACEQRQCGRPRGAPGGTVTGVMRAAPARTGARGARLGHRARRAPSAR